MKIGGLFFGYGGLDLAVQNVIPDAHLAWYSEFDKGANKIAAHRFPDIPNHGDITKIDWADVEPIDILTGGSPCQDLSHAGKRAGMTDGTRSNLWVAMREAIAQLRPSLVVWENVRGAYSAEAYSGLEHCPGCMGDGRPGTVLRALGRVLGDLSDLGYDAGWHGLRAADVGAPHGRFRVFIAASPADSPHRLESVEPAGDGRSRPVDGSESGASHRDHAWRSTARVSLVGGSPGALLPTPAVNDMGAAYTPDEWDAWTDRMKAEHGNGNGHGKSLSIEAQRRTRIITDSLASGAQRLDPGSTSIVTDWGEYADAIHRWERVFGHPAPAPTMLSAKGNPQLAPAFVEFMMGLPAGHVTDVPGITRNEALKALGNGVVVQQAEAALRFLLAALEVAA